MAWQQGVLRTRHTDRQDQRRCKCALDDEELGDATNVGKDATPLRDACWQRRERAIDQHHVADALGNLRAGTERNRHPCGLHGRHVIYAIADHRDVTPTAPEAIDELAFLIRRDAPEHAVGNSNIGNRLKVPRWQVGTADRRGVTKACSLCDRLNRARRVARDDLEVDSLLAKVRNHLGSVGPHLLLQDDDALRGKTWGSRYWRVVVLGDLWQRRGGANDQHTTTLRLEGLNLRRERAHTEHLGSSEHNHHVVQLHPGPLPTRRERQLGEHGLRRVGDRSSNRIR